MPLRPPILSPEENEALRKEIARPRKVTPVVDIKLQEVEPYDDGPSKSEIIINENGEFELKVEAKFLRQLPRAIGKAAWKLIPAHLKARAAIALGASMTSLGATIVYAAIHFAHDIAILVRHAGK